MTSTTTDRLAISEAELAPRLGLSIATLRSWRAKGCGPAFTKLGTRVVYRLDKINEWLEKETHGNQGSVRKLALPVSGQRRRVDRQHGVTGYKTKRDRSKAQGSGSAGASDVGKIWGTPDHGSKIQ
jgi:predicted DNA-binding transcriptional regulator AlpA